MNIVKKKNSAFFLLLFFILILFFFLIVNKYKKEKNIEILSEDITINLITSVHPNLSWDFKSLNPKIKVKPGEVTTIEYIVENFGDKETAGIATFDYYPKQFGAYIRKINCFCYDAQTLKSKETSKYSLILLIDPEVTKDAKTKNIKEVTIQFIFFDYKEYKDNKG